MNSKRVNLLDIGKDKVKLAFVQLCQEIGYLLECKKTLEGIQLQIESKKEEINIFENKIHIESFNKFLKAPQVNDLLRNYMVYLLTISTTKISPKNGVLEDDVISYLMGIIERFFSELKSDDSTIAIESFLSIVFSVCSEVEPVYEEFFVEDGKFKQLEFMQDQLTEKKLFENIVKKVSEAMSQDFIPRNMQYEKVKEKYVKWLKQYYQNGFIYLLGEYRFNDFYIPPVLVGGGKEPFYWQRLIYMNGNEINRFRQNWTHILDTKDIIYVIGGAGYGKSLFLRNLINNYTKLSMDGREEYLVIYCDLKTYYTNGNTNKKTMIDFFQESMINKAGIENITKEFIEYYLERGRCLFLLDALDEVPKDVRGDLHKKIVTFFATCNSSNKVCITSRNRGFIPQQDIEVFEILPLTDKDINDYIDKMIGLKKFKKSDKETFMKQAEALIKKGFLNNFLVLSLLVNIYKAEKELPENKIDLYKKCFEYIAKKREEEKSKIGYNWNNIYPLMKDSTFISLSVLAAPNNKDIIRNDVEELLLRQYKTKYADEITAEQAINEFLEFCSNRTELFVPSAVDDKYKFFHRSFFEYFYSRYIHQQASVEQMYDLMSKFDIDSEVFELSVALVKEDNEEKYQNLIEYIFQKVVEDFSSDNYNGTAFGVLTLAMQVIDDAYFIRKYYDLVLEYSSLMTQQQVLHLNQRLIRTWIGKNIENDEEKKVKFIEAFKSHTLVYFLYLLADENIVKIEREVRMGHRLLVENSDEIQFDIDYRADTIIRNVPFYVRVFNEYVNIEEFIETSTQPTFNNLIKQMDIQVRKKDRNRLRKGYNSYMKLNSRQKKSILEFIAKLKK